MTSPTTVRTTVENPDRAVTPSPEPTRRAVFREPRPEDGFAVWELVKDTPGLDTNSPYSYVLWFRDFADCSLLATVNGEIVGFLTGYRRPDEPDTNKRNFPSGENDGAQSTVGVLISSRASVESPSRGRARMSKFHSPGRCTL